MKNLNLKYKNKILNFLSILLLIVPLSDANAWKFWESDETNSYPAVPNEVSMENLCAKDGTKYGHVIIIIDKTTQLKPPRIDFIKSEVFGEKFYERYEPFTKFSYLLINSESPSSQKFVFSKCRPKRGSKTTYSKQHDISEMESERENLRNIKKAWNHFMQESDKAQKRIFANDVSAKWSMIYETIVHAMRNPNLDFGEEYKNRELIIVSDLLQHSKRFSFYKECNYKTSSQCPDFSKILGKLSDKDYLRGTSPKDENIKIKIIQINNRDETKAEIDSGLIRLWLSYFKEFGYQKPEVIRMLDIN